jgi:L-lactate dehydrogenase complex protein LldG
VSGADDLRRHGPDGTPDTTGDRGGEGGAQGRAPSAAATPTPGVAAKPNKARLLATIRAALRDVPDDETPDDVPVARDYRRSGDLAGAALLDLFVERIEDYKVRVRRCRDADPSATIAAALAERNATRIVVPPDLPDGWLPEGIEALSDPGLSFADLDGSDGVLTGCAVAIAQTGSIVLDAGPAQGRRALTLLPDLHLCVVFAAQVVELVPEAFARLEASGASQRPITVVSGPSATSDIELNRVEGVHGPRTLDVVLVEG